MFAADDAVVEPMCVAWRSCCLAHPSQELRFHLLDCGISEQKLEIAKTYAQSLSAVLRVYPMDVARLDGLSPRLALSTHLSSATLARCFMGSVLPQSCKRVVYLDTDVLVTRPLNALFDLDLDGAVIAGVPDVLDHLADLGIAQGDYINAGVLLVDLEAWRAQDIEKDILDIFSAQDARLLYHDQCAINLALRGKIRPLPGHYNHFHVVKPGHSGDVLPSIFHCTGSPKPWVAPHRHPFGSLYCLFSEGTPWPMDYAAHLHAEAAEMRVNYRRLNPVFRAVVRYARRKGAI
ncbi:MAG: glycosyltransferase family 8 protein [Pseudomonadota bacterium]